MNSIPPITAAQLQPALLSSALALLALLYGLRLLAAGDDAGCVLHHAIALVFAICTVLGVDSGWQIATLYAIALVATEVLR